MKRAEKGHRAREERVDFALGGQRKERGIRKVMEEMERESCAKERKSESDQKEGLEKGLEKEMAREGESVQSSQPEEVGMEMEQEKEELMKP